MRREVPAVYRLVVTIWVGSMWTIGFLVAPTLFSEMESRVQAGALAGTLFAAVAGIGLVCGTLLLGALCAHYGRGIVRSWRAWCVVAMLSLTLIGQFVVTPRVQAAKAGDQSVAAVRGQFARWHAVSGSLFVVNSILGLVLVVAAAPRPAPVL